LTALVVLVVNAVVVAVLAAVLDAVTIGVVVVDVGATQAVEDLVPVVVAVLIVRLGGLRVLWRLWPGCPRRSQFR